MESGLELVLVGEDVELIAEVQQGPRGPAGGGEGSPAVATGTIAVTNTVWSMPHGLDIPEEYLNPALWWFEDENGNPMEPIDVVWSTRDIALAQWDDPVRGTWIVN